MTKQRAIGSVTAKPVLAGIAAASLSLAGAAATAQVQAVDPDAAFGSVPAPGRQTPIKPAPSSAAPRSIPVPPTAPQPVPAEPRAPAPGFDLAEPVGEQAASPASPAQSPATYRKEDLVNAAQGVFGKGARDVAVAIGDILKKQGEPNGYIVGSEGGGAFIFGLRYGSGTLHQKTAAPRPVYWSGPSVGFDAGAAGGNTFVLVYNLADQETLFKRFGAGEGQAYVLGGAHVSYLRRGNMVLIPVRMGVGLRLGVNAGYMKFSRRQNWLPF